MSTDIASLVKKAIESHLASMGLAPPAVVTLEVPPRPEFGDLACPIAFELARRLKRPPREIASGLRAALEILPGVERVEVAGGGYLNIFFDRDRLLRRLAVEVGQPRAASGTGKRIVEHTNINPNKAAHIGHLRNAVLGDTLVRCLRFLGESVEVQNYVDDTGVQVADLAVGFKEIRGLELQSIREIAAHCERGEPWAADTRHFVVDDRGGRFELNRGERFPPDHAFDHYCWNLYAEVAPFYASSAANAALRSAALEQMEAGEGNFAQIASFVAERMVLHHLRTMRWIDVRYDLLPRESDILALGFWERAFELLKESGAIRIAGEGKAQGCWVMDLPDAPEGEDDSAKIIVRSNGTVTYVGKDIAYQLWKFGLLGRDFHYAHLGASPLPPSQTDRIFASAAGGSASGEASGAPAPTGSEVWTTTADPAEAPHPPFGGAERVYNVIDVRQSYLQKVVALGLHALGHVREARDSIHFSYEMVALTPRSVELLSTLKLIPPISLTEEDRARPYLEMSGRRGIGVKAEDLLTALARNAQKQVQDRHPDLAEPARTRIAAQIAIGALRYYMLRFTRNRVVAFDVEESLAFEGETGPYLQYATVRSRNIFNKLAEREGFDRSRADEVIARAHFDALSAEDAIEHWQIVREMARLHETVEQAVSALELSVLARYVFAVAQKFSTFYHRYPILHEAEPSKRELRIALNEVHLRFMEAALPLMGIPVPDRM